MVYLSRNFLPLGEFRHCEFGVAQRLTLTHQKYGHAKLQPLMNQTEHDITGLAYKMGMLTDGKWLIEGLS
jgi:hypothetical protein